MPEHPVRGGALLKASDVGVTLHRSVAAGEADWRRADANGACHPFQSFAWGSVWLETIGAALGAAPRLVRLHGAGGELFLPLVLERGRFGVRRLGFLDGALTDHAAPIVLGAGIELPADEWPRLARRIAAAAGADVIDWRHLTATVGPHRNPLLTSGSTRSAYASHRLDIAGDWSDFARERLSTSHRAGSRRRSRRLQGAGEAAFVVAADTDEALAILELVMAWKAAQYVATGRENRLAVPAWRDFFVAMTRGHLSSGLVHVSALTLDGQVLAAHWGCVHARTFYWLMPAYDVAWSRVSPGRLLLDHLVERAFAERLRAFDFTIGDEPYKATFADRHEVLHRTLHARTPLGLAYAFRARREGRPPTS